MRKLVVVVIAVFAALGMLVPPSFWSAQRFSCRTLLHTQVYLWVICA